MNRKAIKRVADAIQRGTKHTVGFHMASWFNPVDAWNDKSGRGGCKTTACVAGHTVALFDGVRKLRELERGDDLKIGRRAKRILQLTNAEATRLFTAAGYYKSQFDISQQEAVNTLRYAAKHGVIDWNAAQKEAADGNEG